MARAIQALQEEQQERYRHRVLVASILGFRMQPRGASGLHSPPARNISTARGNSPANIAVPLPSYHHWEEGALHVYGCLSAFINTGSAEESKRSWLLSYVIQSCMSTTSCRQQAKS